jgi:hypothetical protein
MWVAIYMCMEAMLGISLYSYLYLCNDIMMAMTLWHHWLVRFSQLHCHLVGWPWCTWSLTDWNMWFITVYEFSVISFPLRTVWLHSIIFEKLYFHFHVGQSIFQFLLIFSLIDVLFRSMGLQIFLFFSQNSAIDLWFSFIVV